MATEGYDDEAKGSEVNNPMMSPQIHRRGTMLLNADGELDTTARSGTTQQHEDVDDEGGESDDESDNDSYFDSNERRRDPSDFAAEAKASRRLSVQEKGEKALGYLQDMLRNNAPVQSSNRRSVDWDAMPKSALEADIIAEEKRIAREEAEAGKQWYDKLDDITTVCPSLVGYLEDNNVSLDYAERAC
ncbi:hypothetical protein TrRE_jg3991, partial [Triparma retinervis]